MIVKRHLAGLLTGLTLLACTLAARADAYVYWVNSAAGAGTTIGRANLDGSGIEQSYITGANDPCGVAVDAEHIYWANLGSNTIGRANLDGTGIDQSFITIASGPSTQFPCGVAVNSTYIYWSNSGNANPGSIGRANLDGSGVSSGYVSGGTVESPVGVALNSQYVFWTNDDSVYRQTLDPAPPQSVETGLAPFVQWPSVTESRLFYSVGLVGILSSDLDGNDDHDVITANAAGGTAILGEKLYWANNLAEGTISRANLDGSSPELGVVTGVDAPHGLAVDAGVPSNAFSFGELKRNKRKGTAKLPVEVPGPGELALGGKGVKPQRPATRSRQLASAKPVTGPGTVKLTIKAKGSKQRKLNQKGKAKLKLTVTYTPTGGIPNAEDTRAKLIKR